MLETSFVNNKKRGRPRKKLEDKLSKVLTTDRQKGFLRNRLAGMNKRQAAIQAGYAPSTASIMAKKLTDRLTCNRIFIEEAQRQGLTVEAIVGEIKRGMTEATHPQYPDQPDNFNRRGYTDMALKIYGGYAPAKLDIKKDTREISYQISIEDQIKAEKTLAECLDLGEKDLIIDDHPDDTLLKPEEEES
jgi:hypothetical protein